MTEEKKNQRHKLTHSHDNKNNNNCDDDGIEIDCVVGDWLSWWKITKKIT